MPSMASLAVNFNFEFCNKSLSNAVGCRFIFSVPSACYDQDIRINSGYFCNEVYAIQLCQSLKTNGINGMLLYFSILSAKTTVTTNMRIVIN